MQKKAADSNNNNSVGKISTVNAIDSTSALGYTVNGIGTSTSIIATRDLTSNAYIWKDGNNTSGGSVYIQFSGNNVQASTTYTIVAPSDTLGHAPGRCHFVFFGNTNNGSATYGTVTTSQASFHRIYFNSILAPSTSSNTVITYTVSEILSF